MMRGLVGRTVVVTGAASGIGAAVVRQVRAAGGDVIGLDAAGSDDPDLRVFDVRSGSEWDSLADELADSGRSVHGLVGCAGVTWRARLGDVSAADFERVQSVNVLGPVLAMQRLAPLMSAGASVVHVGSLAAVQGHHPVAYTASKWAMRGVTHTACLELGRRGIRVNIVHPGFIETPMTADAGTFRAASIDATPLGRTGSPDDVAEVVLFLLDDASSFVSGAEIAVDGGAASHGGAKPVSDALLADYLPPDPTISN